FCFIIQAVAYEYRKKPGNVFGQRTYEIFLFINGSLGIILIGTALGTLFTGGNFIVNEMHLSHWTKQSYGLEAVLTFFNVAFGLMLFFLARVQAALYFLNNINEPHITSRARIVIKYEGGIFLILFFYIVAAILTMQGYGYNASGVVHPEAYKYLHNFLAMPAVAVLFVAGAVLVVWGMFLGAFTQRKRGIWFSGFGTVFVVIALFLILGYNHTAYYPSLADMQSSLTIENSSGSEYTLMAMGYVSLMVPFVLAYIVAVWRVMDRKPIDIDEVQNDAHHY
ncbi:MAG: cytochrome d ubiquinol oxidase subunit II, partial [Sulfurovum sp.]|nr:cytochrome d ubiquinol oxidase subunit II [Sulfurovum sp.]